MTPRTDCYGLPYATMPDPTTTPAEPTVDDAIAEAEAISGDARKWIRAITPILEAYDSDPDRDSRVQEAFDALFVTACARLKRLLRGDLRDPA